MLRLVNKFESYENMGLVKITDMPGKHRRVIAAKNIRIELKNAFPGVKFSVTSESFSMGNAIRVYCHDASIDAEKIHAIVDKYEYGTFDGMTDCQGIRKSDFMDIYGGAKYVTVSLTQ